jgi:hypothetical protein
MRARLGTHANLKDSRNLTLVGNPENPANLVNPVLSFLDRIYRIAGLRLVRGSGRSWDLNFDSAYAC